MKGEALRRAANIIFPLIAIGLMIYYSACAESCSSLKGSLLGQDLEVLGIILMAVLLLIELIPPSRFIGPAGRLRTIMLSGAVGGEIFLVRFQVINSVYCPYCLAFAMCLAILFAVNFKKMNRWLALGAFLAGGAIFFLFFKGSVLPLYG